MPRPKKPESEQTAPLWARFTAAERDQLQAAADAEMLPMAAYLRKAALAYTRQNYEFWTEGQQ
jgi:uncharacterized protein (DUF1778 family)